MRSRRREVQTEAVPAMSKRDEQSDGGSPKQAAMHLRLNGFDIGKRIGEADRASGDWNGDIEKWNAERGAAAFAFAGFAGEGGGELRAGGVVLHAGGIGFGVGENFSGGVNDGGAGSGGLAFLRGDFGERVGVVGFDAVREEQSLLREVAFDLGAQRGFPGAAEHDVENGGGGGDDDQEDGQEFEENAVLHWAPLSRCGRIARNHKGQTSTAPQVRLRCHEGTGITGFLRVPSCSLW